ncbi:MAG: hypothetical protein ACMUIG_10380 [Thermoplasmatota archaeon]
MDRVEDIRNLWKWVLPAGLVVILVLGFSAYQWIIPRTELEVRTVYHEAPGGGGTGGLINLNVLLTNWGNREIEDLDCTAVIREMDGSEMGRGVVEGESLSRKDNVEIIIQFVGSQYNTYSVDMSVRFECSGSTYFRELNYKTHEDQMNLVFVDTVE